MNILGIEGTAWNLSLGLVDESRILFEVEHSYIPPIGGINPREAAQHHASWIPELIQRCLEFAAKNGIPIHGIAFSQGPGLGPCLRIAATAARALALRLGIPLLGVNHCIAHLEIGRWLTGAQDPITVYVSGGNTQILGFLDGRYRVLGETIDIGLGNALDKLGRALGLQHPGGPKIEELAAKSSSYIELPYTVKGMSLAFSGLLTAALEALKRYPAEQVCYSFQETAFAMVTEVAERALAFTGKPELLLVGGVGANSRLKRMLEQMCSQRGARFHAPHPRYMKDNGAMIGYTGLLMLKSGQATSLEESKVIPNFRPDAVQITWR